MRCSVLQSLERHYNNFSLSRELFLLILKRQIPTNPTAHFLAWLEA